MKRIGLILAVLFVISGICVFAEPAREVPREVVREVPVVREVVREVPVIKEVEVQVLSDLNRSMIREVVVEVLKETPIKDSVNQAIYSIPDEVILHYVRQGSMEGSVAAINSIPEQLVVDYVREGTNAAIYSIPDDAILYYVQTGTRDVVNEIPMSLIQDLVEHSVANVVNSIDSDAVIEHAMWKIIEEPVVQDFLIQLLSEL